MEPYRPNEPFIKLKLDGSLLDRMVEMGIPLTRAIQYFRDNPEGSALETFKLAAEDVVPFYGNYRNGGDLSDYAKEAAMLGIPMPYVKYPKGHPKAGEAIPNNLKEGLGSRNWAVAKSQWKNNRSPRLLYTEEALPNKSVPREGLATTNRIGRTQAVVPSEEVFGPHLITNTGSNIQNSGSQIHGTNRIPGRQGSGNYTGAMAWQGEMYPPGRRLRNDEMYGPYQWEDKYSRKLDAGIDANEYKWEYLINKTRPASNSRGAKQVVVPKQDIIDIALNQGRPDIAERVMTDNKPRIPNNKDKRFASYTTGQLHAKYDDAKWKDIGNRQVEKELRETFASLPNDPDIRYRFAEYYGVPDLYQSWLNDPLPWDKLKAETKFNRYKREAGNIHLDKYYKRNIER